MIYYVYTLPPCDDWSAFLPINKYLRHPEGDAGWVKKMRRIAAEAYCWEGNPHTECISAIPDVDNWPIRIYSAKQSNNGTTFVVSPVPLWHLYQDKYHVVDLRLVEWLEPELETQA